MSLELESFYSLVNTMCPPIETLITNFKEYVVSQVKNESGYLQNGTLFYIEYDIPSGYIAKYGKEACLDVLENFLQSNKIKRFVYISDNSIYNQEIYEEDQENKEDENDEDNNYCSNKLEMYKTKLLVKENMYARYEYEIDNDSYSKGDKLIISHSRADGILFPILFTKK